MTPEQREQAIAQDVFCAAKRMVVEQTPLGTDESDRSAMTIAVLWKSLELASEGMSKEALKRLVFGEQPAPQPLTKHCPNGLLPDGPICPGCGGERAPSGFDGGSWVHYATKEQP